jgi:serine/threonine protein kinase
MARTRDLDETMPTAPTPGAVVLAAGDPDPDDLPVGTVIGNYLVERTVAAGGGGIVFASRHRTSGARVAIKVLRAEVASSPEGMVRFQREARVVNLIRHPGIVEIYEFGQLTDGRPYFVMDLLEGHDLKHLITQRGRMSPDEVLQIIVDVCSALEAAHTAGVIHRDLKASNVHVTVADGRFRVKLLDFGIAKLLWPEPGLGGLTQAGASLGTASAMAPEQIRGEAIDQRTDVYGLGVLIYHMLTGRYPFRAETRQEVERMNLQAPAPRPSDAVPVPPVIDEVVTKCMSKKPAGRYSSAREVVEALRKAVETRVPSDLVDHKQAVAVHVDVRLDRDIDEADDELLDDIAQALDLAEQRLRDAAFVVSLHTGTTLLATRLLPTDPAAARDDWRKAAEEAVTLSALLSARQGQTEHLPIDVSLHVGEAEVRGTSASPQIAGPVLEVASWPSATAWRGIRATAAGMAGLDPG